MPKAEFRPFLDGKSSVKKGRKRPIEHQVWSKRAEFWAEFSDQTQSTRTFICWKNEANATWSLKILKVQNTVQKILANQFRHGKRKGDVDTEDLNVCKYLLRIAEIVVQNSPKLAENT